MKALKALLMFAVVLGMIVAGALSLWLGRGVKLALERFGPGIIGAPVSVGAVVLTPWSGRGAITNLVIGNPPGFKGAHALKVGSVEVKIKLSSLATDTVVVESVVVKDPEILYEMGGGGSNLSRLQRNAEAAMPASGAAPAKSGPTKSLFIKDLLVSGGQVGLAASALGGQGATIALPAVQMRNLGGKGRSPAQAVSEVLAAISGSAGKAVSGLGAKALGDAASSVMGKLGGLLKGKR
ncbi:MAG: hypothetical protein HYX59_03635 [Elusimicrobia bacterium]|nr:hypothetical protein [Elusimicrobiota bacterium]